ncbi:c-type cytochrome [Sulfurivirga sp.]|uniref:c-type cytochrome n=1 Tax=Sulfurivirga sp. TaxID=2614236 RepID=UPI0025FA63FB|nr:c-type cytochrome [Sulfurivirga sp.]
MKKWMMLMALSSATLLTACSGGNDQGGQSAQAPAETQPAAQASAPAQKPAESAASMAEKASDMAKSAADKTAEVAKSAGNKVAEVTQSAGEAAAKIAAAAGEKADEAVHAVQGAMTAAKEPVQPKAPADKGAAVYGQCVGCHGPNGGGGVGPKLAGQSAEEIKAKLHDYKAGKQRGPQTAMMAPMAQGLSDEDIEAVAQYIANNFK